MRRADLRRVWRENAWKGTETRSGPGSSREVTQGLSAAIERLLYACESVLDVGCGECNWQPDLPGYVGIDAVPEALEVARVKHPDREFIEADAVSAHLPRAEAVIIRDVIGHLSLEDGAVLVDHVLNDVRPRIITATTFPEVGENVDVRTGEWYPVNMEHHPFLLGPPSELIPDSAGTGRPGDAPRKFMGVWRR